MARCRVMIWNVECFGNFNNLKKGDEFGGSYPGTIWGIAQVILSYGADVVIIQEFRKNGAQHLPNLRASLGRNWSFDYLPGAIKSGIGERIGAVNSIDDLDYTQNGNHEGYAVLWKNTIQLVPFNDLVVNSPWKKMSHGRNNDSGAGGYINLITEGNSYTEDDSLFNPFRINNPAIPIPAKFPKPSSGSTGEITIKTRRRQREDNGPERRTVLFWDNVRRPCIVFIKPRDGINCQNVRINGTDEKVIPVIAHHGPNGDKSPLYSSFAASLSPLFSSGIVAPLVYGGDLNTTDKSELELSEQNMANFGMNSATGTYNPALRDQKHGYGFFRSQSQYVYGFGANHGELIRDGSNYESPRDILYQRGLTNYQLINNNGVIDILADLQDVNSPLARNIFVNDNRLVNNPLKALIKKVSNTPDLIYQLPPRIRTDPNLINSLNQPFTQAGPKCCTSYLVAAIIYRCFISDHLPLAIEFEI